MKQMKVLTVFAALAMTLGLSACGGKKECKTHQWGSWETTKAATCQAEGSEKRVCKKCGKEQTRSVDKLEHQWEEVAGTKVAATCEEAGHYSRKCSLCQTQEDNVEIPALGHDWVDDEDQTAAVAPTCTTAGTKLQHCSHDASHTRSASVDALGHDWGEWVETKAPKCEEAGERKHTCQREGCGVEETEVVAKLGHHLVQQPDDGTTVPAGEAKVRVYECDRDGCDYATFGFKATEVSPDAGQLVDVEYTDPVTGEVEIGKRFWGRPIGNAMELSEDGSASSNDDVKIFDRTVQGDLFEYKFTLTQDQVNALGSDIACYADATPANYLGGQDFWACDPSAQEWTPGYYIDDAHEDQVAIADYRYILYVDDQPVQFDSTMKAPVTADGTGQGNNTNLQRHEFLMPYVFHFTAGPHKISLRMAGGYRSVFYNFIFKSYEAPEVPPEPPVEDPWVLDETTVMPTPAADEATVLRYKNKNDAELVKYEIAAKTGNFQLTDDHSRWKTDPSSGSFKLDKFSSSYGGGEGCSFSFKFSLPAAFEGKMYQRSYMDSYKNNFTKKLYYQTNNHANIEVKFNGGDAIDLSQFAETTFQDVFGDGTGLDNSEVKDVEIGNVVLKTSNSGTFKRVETLNMITSHFVFIGKDHAHTFVYGSEPVQKSGECDYVVGQCAADGAKALKIDASKDLNGKITKRGGKLPKGSSGSYDGTAIASYKFTAPAGFAAKAHLMAVGTVDNAGNYNYSFYTGKVGGSTQNPLSDGSTNTVLTINGKSITMPTATYKEMGCTGLDEAGAGLIDFGEFDVIEGTNEFTLAATNSYGIQYFDFIIAE